LKKLLLSMMDFIVSVVEKKIDLVKEHPLNVFRRNPIP